MNAALSGSRESSGYTPGSKRGGIRKITRREFRRWQLYLLLMPPLVYLIVFHYGAMYGLLIAF
ncbi:MAG: hypothetical protein LBB86_10860, partial [Oscillospiraceae bacterium]|nr:hypothetical protein [Oscillospiraceae bacterium]